METSNHPLDLGSPTEPVRVLPEDTLPANKMAEETVVKASQIPTEKAIREWRRRYVTQKNSIVNACGHKLDPKRPPTNNCWDCWYAYFHECADLVALHEELRSIGSAGMRRAHGNKFVRRFTDFLREELLNWQPEKGSSGISEKTGRTTEEGGKETSPDIHGGTFQSGAVPEHASGSEARDN